MNLPVKPGHTLIFRTVITLRNGKRLHASQCGLKAFPIWVRDEAEENNQVEEGQAEEREDES